MKISYSSKWLIQRITALILIPSSFWFIYNCIAFQNFNFLELQLFFKSYLNCFLFITLMSAMLFHAKLGCETIVQDYISSVVLRNILLVFINFITLISLFLVIIAIIKLNIL